MIPVKRTPTLIDTAVLLGVNIPPEATQVEAEALVNTALAQARLDLAGHGIRTQTPVVLEQLPRPPGK